MRRVWTDERRARLASLYADPANTRRQIAEALGVTVYAVDAQLKSSGLGLGRHRHGSHRDRYPPNPAAMALACRKLAGDLWREAAEGWPAVGLHDGTYISRADAATSMDARAERWEAEARRRKA